jgi:phytoene/squalene synthetase
VDDLGDESAGPDDATSRLLAWQADVERLFSGGTPVHPVLVALAGSVRAHGLPPGPFLDLIQANLQDQHVVRYEDWPALLAYCRRSAAPVGRLVLQLFGVAEPGSGSALLDASDDVCIGLQLANFAQDVRVDRAKGRCYLLQPEVTDLGVAGAVRSMCERARTLLSAGHRLEALTNGRLRLQLALYRLGGEAILDAVADVGYRTDAVRPTVPMRAKVAMLADLLAGRRRGGGDEQRFHIA